MIEHYILDPNHNIVRVDLMEWARWFEDSDRHVASTHVGDRYISTVFLGLDHRFGAYGPPLLFETMVFKGVDPKRYNREDAWGGEETYRYATWDEALAGHEAIVAKLKEEEHGQSGT